MMERKPTADEPKPPRKVARNADGERVELPVEWGKVKKPVADGKTPDRVERQG